MRRHPVQVQRQVGVIGAQHRGCLLYTSDAADERSSVDLGGRRIIKKKNNETNVAELNITMTHYNGQHIIITAQTT